MRKLRLVLVSVGHLPSANPRLCLPLGVMSLAAYARERFDLDILLIDQRAENCSNTSLIDRVAAFAPDVAGFGAMTPAAHLLPELTRGTRQALPRALIVLGGPFVSSASIT